MRIHFFLAPVSVPFLSFRGFLLSGFLLWFVASAPAFSAIDLEEFGRLPDIQSLSISPDGKHIAFLRRKDDEKMLLVLKLDDGSVVGGARIGGKLKARSVYFATNSHVILRASDTVRLFGYRNINKLEMSGAFAFSLKTKKTRVLLNRTKGLHPAQSGLGRIVGVNAEKNVAYMPAYIEGNQPPNDLFEVNLKTGFGRRHARGKSHTIDWFVANDGTVLAREDYQEKTQEHRI